MEAKEILSAITLVMAVVIFAVVGSLIIGTFLDSPIFDPITISGTNTNESLGVVNNITNSTFAIISSQPEATCSLSTAYNASGEVILETGNYTFYSSACKIILQSTSPFIGEVLNVTYVYSYSSNISVAGIDVEAIKTNFGLFITGLIAFLAIIGTIVGVIWLVYYVKTLFDKKTGLQSITA